jgi:hypothetical protein
MALIHIGHRECDGGFMFQEKSTRTSRTEEQPTGLQEEEMPRYF